MTRRTIAFECDGDHLVGTLDVADGRTGLLVASGGNEIRVGAHRGMALLAQRVAEAGFPVLRFDRRGIGDSEGDNRGFRESADDIAAAVQAFRRHLPVERIVGFGNCDAATALAIFGARSGLDALLLANPWVVEADSGTPPPAAIRARYASRLRDPKQWLRMLRGGVNIPKLTKGLFTSLRSGSEETSALARLFLEALESGSIPATILLAERDNTAIAFRGEWDRLAHPAPIALHVCDSASHSFAREGDAEWLHDRVIEALTSP